MFKIFIFLFLFNIIKLNPICNGGENHCLRCNTITNLCINFINITIKLFYPNNLYLGRQKLYVIKIYILLMKMVVVDIQKNVLLEIIIVLNVQKKEIYVKNVKKDISKMKMGAVPIALIVKYHIKGNASNVKIIIF